MVSVLAFLNLGPTEVLLVLLMLLLFFGAEQLPALARRVGQLKGQFERAQQQLENAVQTAESKALDEQLAFERTRDLHVQKQAVQRRDLEQEAAQVGVLIEGLSEHEIRTAIAAKRALEEEDK